MPAATLESDALRRARAIAPRLRRALLAWFARARRDLPWRRTRDPYAILVSELMLQQTRVDVVVPYYERFLARFADVATLALAPEQDVLAAWAGLGYYRRARFLQQAARAIVDRHGGSFPRDADVLRELPGIGRYTAGAVASIAFGARAALVDGNVARVLARWFALEGDPRAGAGEKRAWALAEALLDARQPGDFNQALMELGACICTPRAPRCGECPVIEFCEAARLGTPERFPPARARKPTIDVRLAVLALRDARGRVALVRRAPGARMEGMLDLPGLELGRHEDAAAELVKYVRVAFGVHCSPPVHTGTAKHAITHHRIALDVYCAAEEPRPRERGAVPRDRRDPSPAGIAARPDAAGLMRRHRVQLEADAFTSLARKSLRHAWK